jgi:hypothetical protein
MKLGAGLLNAPAVANSVGLLANPVWLGMLNRVERSGRSSLHN